MILYYSVHFPKPEKEAQLIDGMRQVGQVLKSLPGCVYDNAFRDADRGTIMAVMIWESQETFQAARPAMMEALKTIPLDEWEARPRELYMLNSLW